MNFIWLIFAHFIGDIALQSSWQADNKGRLWYVMFSHCMIWTALICAGLQFLGILTLWKVLFLVGGHYLLDSWKSKIPKTAENWKYIYPDQLGHLIQLVIVYLF